VGWYLPVVLPKGSVLKARANWGDRWLSIRILLVAVALVLCAARSTRADQAAPAIGGDTADPLDDEVGSAPEVWDPIEGVNRRTFRVNQVIDRFFLDPITRAYAFVVPNPARRAVRRVLLNLESPAIFANDVLQLAPVDATVTLTRFAINTTAGVGGLFDPAARMGLDRHHTDFGQTLALYGVPSGPYVVFPLLGPTTVRDGSGYAVDFLFQPTTYVLPGVTLFIYASIHQGSAGLAAREAYAAQLRALEASSVDFYAALRSAYYQDRTAAIAERAGRGPRALARILGAVSLDPPGSEVVDLAAHGLRERVEPLTLEK
jgi:phospholipid-binding lipoprotein MlaA